MDQVKAQQTHTASQSGAGAAVENNGEDFTRPEISFSCATTTRQHPAAAARPAQFGR
jgi:hypothetical protein